MTQVMQLMSQEQRLQSEHLLVLLWEQSLHQIVESFRALAIPFCVLWCLTQLDLASGSSKSFKISY
jgi:hypothetical protein